MSAPLNWYRRLAGWVLSVTGPIALTAAFLAVGVHDLGTDSGATTLNFLCHLTVVVFVALLGGWWPAVASALFSTMLLNWFFTPPTHQWIIHEPLNVAALGLLLLVAAGVARVVDIEARRTAEAERARQQADVLFELARGVISEGHSVPALLDRLRRGYGLRGVALAYKDSSTTAAAPVDVLASSGAVTADAASAQRVPVDQRHELLLWGGTRAEQQVFTAFAARIGVVLQHQELAEARLRARELAAGNDMRTALLAAVSHDLRTPLAGIKAAVSSLRMEDVVFDAADTAELLATIEDSADQLEERIEDLLDMSRIQSGELVVHRGPLEWEDLVAAAVHSLGAAADPGRIRVAVHPDAAAVLGDHGLLVRVIANLLENALKHSDGQVTVSGGETRLAGSPLRVADCGPGVADADKERIFRPFQRLGDRDNTAGVGLGLAVARGLTEGMGGTVHAEDTPGGGLTMVLTLPVAGTSDPAAPLSAASEQDRHPQGDPA